MRRSLLLVVTLLLLLPLLHSGSKSDQPRQPVSFNSDALPIGDPPPVCPTPPCIPQQGIVSINQQEIVPGMLKAIQKGERIQ
jgi:hypothetical protein